MKQREVLKVKVGDIVYFKESHTANYVQGQYDFLIDVPYIVVKSGSGNCTIKAPGSGICTIKAPDGTEHFIYSTREYGDPYGKLISSRERNLKKLGL